MSKFEMNMLRQSLSLLTENLFQDFFLSLLLFFYTAFKKEVIFLGWLKISFSSALKYSD